MVHLKMLAEVPAMHSIRCHDVGVWPGQRERHPFNLGSHVL